MVVGQQEVNSVAQNNSQIKEVMMGKKEGFIGVLEVFIHQARNIHNICIYHKQDVYAKIFLTSDPESTESTRTIDGGGQNPVFNENLRINVRNGDCSLRCEIWMLSRIKNYLEDQLLGFALVPLCEIINENGKLEKEFELSTSELIHSPLGFVKLSIVYTGSPPDVLEIPTPSRSLCDQDSNESEQVFEKIEFPDPKIMNENEIMVSEYYSISAENDDSVSSDSRFSKENLETTFSDHSEASGKIEENTQGFSDTKPEHSNDHLVSNFPKENLETTTFSDQSEASGKTEENAQSFSDTNPDQKTMQQEIVDMYLKSMNQFTEALANMNLPIDKENESFDSKSNGEKSNSKEEGQGTKVFYGSRAFF